MSHWDESTPSILIASDKPIIAELVKKHLKDEFEQIHISADPGEIAADFDRQPVDVLILAFNGLEISKRHNLELHRDSREVQRRVFRTLILCDKGQAQKAYELCRDGVFDDYVLFWPSNYDSARLPMAVHQAMHELSFNRDVGPTPKAFATQVRRLGELELLLKRRMKQGDSQIESVGHAIALGVQEIGAAFDGFSRQLVQGELSTLVEVKDANALEQAFLQLKQVHISVPLQAMTDSVAPLKQWACELQVASAPHLESLRAASALAGRVHSTVMVVDDEKFQFEFISKMLKDEPYRFVFASSGAEAMKMLRQVQPDVLLMDFKMPKMDGVEVLRWMKGSSRYVNIPIIMITSNSEESVVEACLKAGATDFMVKPLNRKALISKVANVLGLKTSPLPTQPPDIYESDV